MIKFTFENGRVRIKPEDLLIQALRRVWDNDTDPRKDKGTRDLTYVFFMADSSQLNPMYGKSKNERPLLALREAYGSVGYEFSDIEYEMIQEAIAAYIHYNDTPEKRTYDQYGDEVDMFLDMLAMEENKPEMVKVTHPTSKAVTFSSNSKIISEVMKDIDKILEARDKIVSRMEKTSETRNKRNYQESASEKKLIQYKGSKGMRKLP